MQYQYIYIYIYINEKIKDKENMTLKQKILEQMNLSGIYRTFHPKPHKSTFLQIYKGFSL